LKNPQHRKRKAQNTSALFQQFGYFRVIVHKGRPLYRSPSVGAYFREAKKREWKRMPGPGAPGKSRERRTLRKSKRHVFGRSVLFGPSIYWHFLICATTSVANYLVSARAMYNVQKNRSNAVSRVNEGAKWTNCPSASEEKFPFAQHIGARLSILTIEESRNQKASRDQKHRVRNSCPDLLLSGLAIDSREISLIRPRTDWKANIIHRLPEWKRLDCFALPKFRGHAKSRETTHA
jgi:hypothetical protein